MLIILTTNTETCLEIENKEYQIEKLPKWINRVEECVTKAFNSQIFQKSLEFLESEISDSKDTIEDNIIVVSFTKLLRITIISGKSLTRNHNRFPKKNDLMKIVKVRQELLIRWPMYSLVPRLPPPCRAQL